MDSSLELLGVAQAHEAFRNGRYHTARNLYRASAKAMGERLFAANFQLCNRAERSQFLRHTEQCYLHSSVKEEQITYCVPIFNRLGDLKKTLLPNLEVLAQFRSVKLIINLFDQGDEAYRWATKTGKVYMKAGLLSVNQMPPLQKWHFSRAKNSFANLVQSGYYSSLDGDNYLTVEEVLRTKQAVAEYGPCLIHHFYGDWGDGSCGRMTLPAALYRQGRYNDDLFPRQFDEFSLILNALNLQPDLPVISRYGVNCFHKSHYLRLLAKHDGWKYTPTECDLGRPCAPENPKEDTYVKQDPVVRCFGWINGYYSLYKAARTAQGREEFARRLYSALNHAQRSEHFPALAQQVFHPCRHTAFSPQSAQKTQIALVKHCTVETQSWLAQQRAMGVAQFLIVEYGASVGQSEPILGKDVLIHRPIVGSNDLFSNFWIESLKVLYNLSNPVQTPSVSSSTAARR